MITTKNETSARWIVLGNGKRVLAFGYETDAQAQVRYDRIDAVNAELDLFENEERVEEAPEQAEETVWVPVSERYEVELTLTDGWKIFDLMNRFRQQRRMGCQFDAMKIMKELKGLGHGLTGREYGAVADWMVANH